MKKYLINWVVFAAVAVWSFGPAQADTAVNSVIGQQGPDFFKQGKNRL